MRLDLARRLDALELWILLGVAYAVCAVFFLAMLPCNLAFWWRHRADR